MRLAIRFLPVVLVGAAVGLCAFVPVRRMLSYEPATQTAHAGRSAAKAQREAVRHAPSATCSQPASATASRLGLARFIAPAGLRVAATDTDLERVFARWEAASAELEPVDLHERRRLVALYHPGRSAHELDLICELRGPIEADSLAGRYKWRPPIGGPTHIELTAETYNAIERLFFQRFTVKLDRTAFLPVSVQFTDGTGTGTSLPFALETSLGLEARLARAVRDPDDFPPAIVPARYDANDRDPPAPLDLPLRSRETHPIQP